MSGAPVYWSDQAASSILAERGSNITIATGITPSGPIHIGNLREVLTAHAIYRSLEGMGSSPRFIYIADTFDPLRKVYPFLPAEYEKYVGWPLYRIPDPEGCCASYAAHFVKPFVAALGELGVKVEVLEAHEIARSGAYKDVVAEALLGSDKIKEIIREVTGRTLPEDWSPYQAECASCHSISDTKTGEFDGSAGLVSYTCKCGHAGKADISKGEGKLMWRVDWPARWKALGVSVEPFGKDHAAAGGSYDTGVRISREVFGYEPPFPYIYEWIYLKGQGAMASSTGVAISTEEMLKVVQPEVLRYLVLRVRPEKHIDFEPGHGMTKAIDEYQALANGYVRGELEALEKRIFEMSATGEVTIDQEMHISFTHFAVLVQIAQGSVDKAFEIIERSGYSLSDQQKDFYRSMTEKVWHWLSSYAPDDLRFTVQKDLPDVSSLSDGQKAMLSELAQKVEGLDNAAESSAGGENGEEHLASVMHNLIYNTGNAHGLKPKESFGAIYRVLLDRSAGPRAGFFAASLDRDFLVRRFKEAGAS